LSQEIDYKKEFFTLVDFITDVGLQLQVFAKNNKDRVNQSLSQNLTKSVGDTEEQNSET